MTQEELDNLKQEIEADLALKLQSDQTKIKTNTSWLKWLLGGVLASFATFTVVTIANMNAVGNLREDILLFKQEIQNTYVSKSENYKFKEEINKRFSLPIQMVMAQNKQIQAKLIDRDPTKFSMAKEEEYKIVQEMVKLNYDVPRGDK